MLTSLIGFNVLKGTVEVDLGTPKCCGTFTLTLAAITPASIIQVWQAPGPYTGKGTLADEAEMEPVSVIYAEPLNGSAVVSWQVPPMLVYVPIIASGRQNTSAQNSQLGPSSITQRAGVVSGKVKFNYLVVN
jgi:hypothetical protein